MAAAKKEGVVGGMVLAEEKVDFAMIVAPKGNKGSTTDEAKKVTVDGVKLEETTND